MVHAMSQITYSPMQNKRKKENLFFYTCKMYNGCSLYFVTVCLFVDVSYKWNCVSAAGECILCLLA